MIRENFLLPTRLIEWEYPRRSRDEVRIVSKIWSGWRRTTPRVRRRSAASVPESTGRVAHSCYGDEELAAFFDGRLGERERSEMIGHLAEAEDAFEIFACTAAMLLDGDALLKKMQTPEVRAASRRAFDASPDELRKAAMEAARDSGR